ncbi:ATP-binding cassette domain-containing protein [Streptomyces sp. NPDC015127]|uniref:ATP-binding cassette domain-containing protein n=1 Tax=Streptomyces sp. NPDC015127 TaxID=3364939 RepID=UPI0037032B3C
MIRFEHVGKVYPDGTTAVDDLSCDVTEGELVTLVGPSGCGKTTTTMMVNRLIEPTAGRILVDGADIAAVDPVKLRRRIGYSAKAAASRLRAEGARWAVVLGGDGTLHGWVSDDSLAIAGEQGTVGDLTRRMDAWVPVGAPLKQAFSEMLPHDAGWVAVLDGTRFLGVLTPAKLHEALRRSVDADAQGVARDQVEFDSVADA